MNATFPKTFDSNAPAPAAGFEPGDLLIFFGRDLVSRTIELATRGPSHVGIVCPIYNHGTLLVESTTLCDLPCRINCIAKQGVQFHPPAERIARYPGSVRRLRLADGWKLDAAELEFLAGWFWHRRKLGYDLRDAIISGTRLFKWTALLPYADSGSQFCSELCAAALMRVGRLALENPTVYNPASLVRKLLRCGIYTPPEVNRP